MSRRITNAIVAVVLASLVLAGIGTFVFARVANRDRELRRLEQQAEAIAELVPPGTVVGRPVPADATGAAGQRAKLRERVAAVVQLTGVTELVLRADGTWQGELPTGVSRDDLDTAALRAGDTLSGARLALLWAAAGRTDERGVTTVIVITTRQEALFGPTMRWFFVFAVVALAVGGAVAWWLGRRLARPVHDAVDTTRRLAAGDLTARMPVTPAPDDPDELAVLGRSVDALAHELERSRGLERQFLMSVSHDLRTPLTSIRGYAEAIADGMADDPARAAEVIVAESQRLERLVADLLDLAKLDARRFRFDLAHVEAHDLLGAAARRIEPAVLAAGLRLAVDDRADATLHVDGDRVVQAIGNLSANALHFARSTVWLRSRLEPADSRAPLGWVSIDVGDDGPGIPAADLPHVFERLYQAANQPQRKESGTGLGLAIVRELAEAMGGEVTVASEVGTGSTFTVRFPIAGDGAPPVSPRPPAAAAAPPP